MGLARQRSHTETETAERRGCNVERGDNRAAIECQHAEDPGHIALESAGSFFCCQGVLMPYATCMTKGASCGAALASGWGSGALEKENKGGARGADTKSRRVDGAARGQQQQQQEMEVVDSTPGTHLPFVRGAWPSGTRPLPARTASSMVLTRFELLVQIMGYLGGAGAKPRQHLRFGTLVSYGDTAERAMLKESRRALGDIALVCRAWRDAAQHEELWEPLTKELIPRLAFSSSAEELIPRHS